MVLSSSWYPDFFKRLQPSNLTTAHYTQGGDPDVALAHDFDDDLLSFADVPFNAYIGTADDDDVDPLATFDAYVSEYRHRRAPRPIWKKPEDRARSTSTYDSNVQPIRFKRDERPRPAPWSAKARQIFTHPYARGRGGPGRGPRSGGSWQRRPSHGDRGPQRPRYTGSDAPTFRDSHDRDAPNRDRRDLERSVLEKAFDKIVHALSFTKLPGQTDQALRDHQIRYIRRIG